MAEFEKLIKAMDAEKLMKAVADGFKSMSQAIDSLAGHIEALSKTEAVTRKKAKATTKKAPKKAKKAAPKAAAKKVTKKSKAAAKKAAPKATAKKAKSAPPKKAKKKTAPKKSSKATAIDSIYGYISRARNGINVENLIKKTGYDNKKVHNVLYKLKKQNKVKSVKRGIYEKV